MAITIADLVADPQLGLKLRSGGGTLLQRPVEWAAATELVDPSQFLTGGELVCTTGMRLRSIRSIRTFLEAVRQAGSCGVAFGVGFTHAEIPEVLLDEARRRDLPVLEVPAKLSFTAIARKVAAAQATQEFARLESQHRRQQRLVEALLGDGGIGAMLDRLGHDTGAHIALSFNGEIVSGSLEVDDNRITGWEAMPIAVGSRAQATLHVSLPHSNRALLLSARSLIGLHLAQVTRDLRKLRERNGQVLSDLIEGRLPDERVTPRLESIGLDPTTSYRLIVVADDGKRPNALASLPLPSSLDGLAAGMHENKLAVAVPAMHPPRKAAEALLAATRAAGIGARIGIGGPYPAAAPLRWSWFEAIDALDRNADEVISTAGRLSIASLMLAAAKAPVLEFAASVLEPLERADAEHGSQLVETLDAVLNHSGAINEVAAKLGTHRNTVRYRIEQIYRLTGLDPRSTPDAVQLTLARTARRLNRSE